MIITIIKFLPAMVANAFPVILKKIPILDEPISSKLFGKNKTWKGFIGAVILAGLVGHLIGYFSTYFQFPIIMNGKIGLILGTGAMLGDLIKSFFKRRMKLKCGEGWFPWDQIDWIVGAFILSYPLFTFNEFLFILFFGFSLHILMNKLALALKLKRNY